MSEDILDSYLTKRPGTGAELLTPDEVYANSGHRLLCPKCRKFQRTSIDLLEGPVLRIRCKVCGTTEDFVYMRDGWTPKWLAERMQDFARRRAYEIAGGKTDAR